MPLIQWNDSLRVNIAEIDAQHHRLVDMINDLNEAMKIGKGKEILGKIVQGLIDYAQTHFRTEEKYFDRFGYPEGAMHKREHSAFTAKVSEFKSAFDSGKAALSVEVMTFLSDWLQQHIKGSDRKYGVLLNQMGLR